MQIYLVDKISSDNKVILTQDDAKHCAIVMRNKTGDTIWGTNGQGVAYQMKIVEIQKNQVIAKVQETISNFGEPFQPVYLAFAILSNPSRMEILVEKAVELGVTHLLPFAAKRSEKKNLNIERMKRICIAAMKQCKRSKIPELQLFQNTNDLFQYANSIKSLKLIGFC
ncbi:MAG: RsmE family RNA methyltransferase, partial [Ignavibacterium sp.]